MNDDKNRWDGPHDFYTAIKQWAENDKTIMYQFESNRIVFDRGVMSGGVPTTHNISKKHILEAKWYIENTDYKSG